MAGAAVLAVRAAMRGGAGIVRAVSHPTNREILQVAAPGAVFADWDDGESVADAVSWSHALAIGPGMGRDADGLSLVASVLEGRGDRPVVVDADGLSVWQGRADELADLLTDRDVITPHPGEMARMLDAEVEAIVADPPASAAEAARRFGCTVVLKGAPSIVAAGEGPLLVTTVGGSALAAGGSGDVLTGLIGAYLAAGMTATSAAASALFLSGLAAELGRHPAGHAADEIPDRIPAVREKVERLPGHGSGAVIFASASPEKPGGGL
jgi:NAD(P)H-hydrate epimerase